MNERSNSGGNAEELRQRAERRLAGKSVDEADAQLAQHRLLHELQVHQIELELQNEALLEARATAEMALERYTELFDFAPVAYFNLGVNGLIRQTNFRGGELLGLERSKLIGRNFADSVSAAYRPVFNRFLETIFAEDGGQSCEITLQDGDTPRWVSVIEATVDKIRQNCLVAVLDIGERKRGEQELQLAATIYLALEEAVMVSDENNRIVAVNPAFSRLTGYSEKEAVGQPTSLLRSGRQDQPFYREMWQKLNSGGQWQGEIWNRRKNGDVYLEWLRIGTVYGKSGEVIRRVATSSDITERNRAEEFMRTQANIDPLTGLPNRRLFLDRLRRAINKSRRSRRKLALMFLDLDHFKDINDTLGHDIGDSLLKETSKRLTGCIREIDTLARPGGDEFTLVMGELDERGRIDRVAQCIQECMAAPFQLKDESCYVSVSVGIALYPDDADNLEDLLKKADQAMYAAKAQGRGRFCYFTPAMQKAAEIRLRLSNDLRQALAEKQIWVAFQPIVKLASGEIQKAEALIRWQHPSRGLISPAEFIPIAEETGMITELGEWVFQQVATQVALWRTAHYPQFQISINKSPAQFHNNNDNLSDWFEALRHLGLPGGSIAVEITEGLLLDTSPIVAEKLLAFKDAGMQVSLDDFGTGYSSLSYLKKYHIDFLKIDRGFICNLEADSTELALCKVIIQMAHILSMKVIAEGVETAQQRDLLIQAGCDYGQGYFFSKPVAASEFEKLFQYESLPG